MIRFIQPSDYLAITNIYNYYIANQTSTFEIEELTIQQQTERIKEISQKFPYFVYENNGEILGFCYVHQFHSRSAYNESLELSVYLNQHHKTKGLGSKLLDHLLTYLKENTNYHTVISLITLPNIASQHLHEKFGFEYCGKLKEVGYKSNQWLDVGYYQLML